MKAVRVRMMDSMARHLSRDTVLNVATEAELAKYFAGRAKVDFGKVWLGFFEPMLDQMEPVTREELREQVSAYQASMTSGSMERGPAGSLANTGDATNSLRQWRDRIGRQCNDINKANRKFWHPNKPAA